MVEVSALGLNAGPDDDFDDQVNDEVFDSSLSVGHAFTLEPTREYS